MSNNLGRVDERSTLIVELKFKDESGAAVIPQTANWTLSDTQGAIINNRSSVAISPLAATVNIVLTGLDLALGGAYGEERIVTVRATYNSSLGEGLHLSAEFRFSITPLFGVS